MNAWTEMERIRAEMEELREMLRQLGQALAAWEGLARRGEGEAPAELVDKLGMQRNFFAKRFGGKFDVEIR